MNIDILGISELNGLKWVNLTRMAIIAASVGRNPLEKWRGHHSRQKSPKCSTRVQSQNQQKDLCSLPRQTTITVIHIYAATSNAKKAEAEWLCEGL